MFCEPQGGWLLASDSTDQEAEVWFLCYYVFGLFLRNRDAVDLYSDHIRYYVISQ